MVETRQKTTAKTMTEDSQHEPQGASGVMAYSPPGRSDISPSPPPRHNREMLLEISQQIKELKNSVDSHKAKIEKRMDDMEYSMKQHMHKKIQDLKSDIDKKVSHIHNKVDSIEDRLAALESTAQGRLPMGTDSQL